MIFQVWQTWSNFVKFDIFVNIYLLEIQTLTPVFPLRIISLGQFDKI